VARNTYEGWIPEEYSSDVITRITQVSAVESVARKIPMATDLKSVPRSAGVAVTLVPKGNAYGEDTSVNDAVVLDAQKFGTLLRIAEEDLDDVLVDVINTKKADWATSYAKYLDNACLAVTAAAVGAGVPFVSVYAAVTNTDSSVSYTANANYVAAGNSLGTVTLTDVGDVVTTVNPHGLKADDRVKVGTVTSTTGITAGTTYYVLSVLSSTTFTLSATVGGSILALTTNGSAINAVGQFNTATYQNLSAVLGLAEGSDYFDEGNMVVIAHPSARGMLRSVVDSQGRPIFQSGDASSSDMLFGYKIRYSLGAKTAATATSSPTGNPLVIVGPASSLILGVRSGPESFVSDGSNGASMTTDETLIKMRARRGFVVANPFAFGVLEIAA
jgi:hypothetical protein